MDAKTSLKSRLPSRHATEGPERAPHRAFYYAMGLTTEQIHQPFVGVASCWNEAAPCNISLMRQTQAVKQGVASVGGTPREFCTITVTDGIAMGHGGMKASLPSREVIADSIELTMRGHSYDALVGVAGCDKSQPGMMMAMCRLNVPSIFIYGGSILPGTFKGKPVTIQDVYEAVGKHSIGAMSDDDLELLEQNACPSAGACGAQFTANTMATVSEAIGLALPYSAGAPAPYEIRDRFCMLAGEMIMDLIVKNIRPRDIVTREALENAAAVVAATGGSTNAALHLPAIANECGIKFDLFDVAEILKKTPYIADLKPSGRYVAKDMFEAGGVPLLMRTLLDHGFLHGDCLTVTGRTMAENLRSVKWNPDQDVVRPADRPLSATGGVVGLKGNLAPEGAIVKVAGMERVQFLRAGALLRRRGSLFRCGGEQKVQGRRRARHPLRGTERRSRHARNAVDDGGALRPGHGRQSRPHHRRAVLRRDARLLRRPCRSGSRDRRSDRRWFVTATSSNSMPKRAPSRSSCPTASSSGAAREWKPRPGEFTSGYLWKYAQQVGPARDGARHPPGRVGRERVLCGHLTDSARREPSAGGLLGLPVVCAIAG